eukprot:457064-Prymnesium_polylepis.1
MTGLGAASAHARLHSNRRVRAGVARRARGPKHRHARAALGRGCSDLPGARAGSRAHPVELVARVLLLDHDGPHVDEPAHAVCVVMHAVDPLEAEHRIDPIHLGIALRQRHRRVGRVPLAPALPALLGAAAPSLLESRAAALALAVASALAEATALATALTTLAALAALVLDEHDKQPLVSGGPCAC